MKRKENTIDDSSLDFNNQYVGFNNKTYSDGNDEEASFNLPEIIRTTTDWNQAKKMVSNRYANNNCPPIQYEYRIKRIKMRSKKLQEIKKDFALFSNRAPSKFDRTVPIQNLQDLSKSYDEVFLY